MIAVVGGGSWGTALARLVALSGTPALLVCRTTDQARRMARERRAVGYLKGVDLPDAVRVGSLDDVATLRDADLVVAAVPTRALHECAGWLSERLAPGARFLSLMKGLDPVSGLRLSEAWEHALSVPIRFAALSGPNHAEEVAAGQPTATVVAGDSELCRDVQGLLNGPRFRVYVNEDLIGVELCGAAKNVIAIAAGMSDGMGAGDNAKASLITRGLAEMTRLGVACGARDGTFRGLAGMGDLVATCTSPHSRNRRAGELIAEGLEADRVDQRLGQVAEGLWTVRALLELSGSVSVELPISQQVLAAAFEGRPIEQCMKALMAREPVSEE
ncbi:MAG: NAD(P)H-dependent glycerol-3-phosphate dehydrogenase [Miltoncostaeaceae bacterium]